MLILVLCLFSALLIPGIILRTKSVCSGRKGPGLFQPLMDVRVLCRKGKVVSPVSTLVFAIAPSVSLATAITAVLLVPMGKQDAILSFPGDFVFFTYVLALGRFFMILAAMDSGSAFQGMGANREALYSLLAEPVFLLLIGTYAMFTGFTSFTDIFSHFYFGNDYAFIAGILGFYLLIQIAMIENARLPVDDPKTHLELTMVHEVMVLDYSGFDLALIHLSTWVKFAIFGALVSNSLVPANWPLGLQIGLFMLLQMVFGIVIGLLESFRARNKLAKNPQFILTLIAIGFLVFIIMLMSKYIPLT